MGLKTTYTKNQLVSLPDNKIKLSWNMCHRLIRMLKHISETK